MVGAIGGSTQREPIVVGKPSTFMMDYVAKEYAPTPTPYSFYFFFVLLYAIYMFSYTYINNMSPSLFAVICESAWIPSLGTNPAAICSHYS